MAWITTGDVAQAADALTRLALYDPDRVWVEGLCCGFAYHPDPLLRRAVIFCFQNYIWGHRALSIDTVLPVLNVLSTDSDPTVAVDAQDTIADSYRLLFHTDDNDDH